jgi:diguanylate cyclase (GGDEF)-like protein
MKISGVQAEPFSALRRPGRASGSITATSESPGADQAQFLGVAEAELTPQVRAAIAMLVVELEDLRNEVRRLKAQLAEAEAAADADPLTGVKNRRAFVRELRRVSAFVQRYGAPASVVYIDLDDLKGMNDRLGHAAGDAALKAVAERLSAHVRESDVVGRLGGDEFAVALVHADRAAAIAKAEALAAVVEAEPVAGGEWLAPLRVSWGVSEVDPSLDPETLIAQADHLMFAMKRERR